MYSSIASASSESRATSPGTPLVRHSAGTSSESAGTLGMKPHASASALSGSEVSRASERARSWLGSRSRLGFGLGSRLGLGLPPPRARA